MRGRGSGIGQKSAAGTGGFGRLKESQAKVGVLVLSGQSDEVF